MKKIMLKVAHGYVNIGGAHGHAFNLEDEMEVVCEDKLCELVRWVCGEGRV